MITNLPPPGGVSPHQAPHHGTTPESAMPPHQDSFSHFEEDFQTPQQYPPQQHYQHQYYPQYPQQYPQQQQQPQVPHWHHQHGYYNPYPPQGQQQPPHQTYPNYSPSDPSSGGYYPQSNGYYDQPQHPNNGVPPGGQSTHNCTPSPLANSDDSGGDCVNESKGSQTLRGGIVPLIPRPKGPRPTTSVMSAKRGGKRARQRDPNEPQKPVSAYALFFRDVQAGIKARNPAASFGEVSKHVAALWDGMDPDSKGAYKRRTEQAKKEYLRQLAAYRATLVSKGNTLENPYNGKGLEVTKVGEERNYLMNQRMTESSGYGSNSNTLTPLGSGPTPSSPQSTMGQSPNNGYHLNQQQQHHLRHMSPDTRYPGASYQQTDPYDQDVLMSNCKRPGCPNPIRMNSSRPMPEYCSNDCLVNDNNNKQLYNNTWSQEQQQQQQPTQQPQQPQPPQQSPTSAD